MTNLSGYPVPV